MTEFIINQGPEEGWSSDGPGWNNYPDQPQPSSHPQSGGSIWNQL